MVNVKQIEKLLQHHFIIDGDYQIDPVSGQISVEGHVRMDKSRWVKHLPVHFLTVDGDFDCDHNILLSLKGSPRVVHGDCNFEHNMLKSLEGAPDHVGGNFLCNNNMLRSLKHAPDHVDGEFICSQNYLTDLQGLPEHMGNGFYATYNTEMPLLRLLHHTQVELWQVPDAVNDILNRYVGTGKSHILLCSNELKQAGYKDNARW
jgi:hypothetical protein